MAYRVCVRSNIIELGHWRDNTITGTIEIDGSNYGFKSRGHVAKAVNRYYAERSWKPETGKPILFDGDVFKDQVIIDHIEPWSPTDFHVLTRHQDLQQRLLEKLPELPEASKTLRHSAHDDHGTSVRCLRWLKPAKAQMGRKSVPVIVSAIAADQEIRFAFRAVKGAANIGQEKVAVLPLLAETLGIPFLQAEAKTEHAPAAKNPNKWIPGKPYRPIGMPQPEITPAAAYEPASDCPF